MEPPLPGDEGVLKGNLDVRDYEDWEERAAIHEYGGGLERNEAEQRARIMNTRVVLVGMQPEVAITLLEMGLEFADSGEIVIAAGGGKG